SFHVVLIGMLSSFFNALAPTYIYTLSLHDALPICLFSLRAGTARHGYRPDPSDDGGGLSAARVGHQATGHRRGVPVTAGFPSGQAVVAECPRPAEHYAHPGRARPGGDQAGVALNRSLANYPKNQ